MAVIHHTTLTPTKVELLGAWLPSRPWYGGTGSAPRLARAGGFRLDDPEGEVGIEFLVVIDGPGDAAPAYLTPLTYRATPLDGGRAGLIGTLEHGVLGKRWVYDGAHDPVLVGQLLALLAGRVAAQAQGESDTPDPTVEVRTVDADLPAGLTEVTETTGATVLAAPGAPVTLSLTRVLRPGPAAGRDVRGQVLAPWSAPDGAAPRGAFAVLRDSAR
ncbi:1,4-alpha-glucan branching protein [Streptomyces sp. NPDC048383]|uniref:maltokinase N-terminal cap-like domain-containing protein n=1 Tax=Streptomyces sp. NPDC048383 TaxID=3155386 RepID=UPI0034478493